MNAESQAPLDAVAQRPARPVLLYDRDCGFCRRWVRRWRGAAGDSVDFAPYQSVAHNFPQVRPDRAAEAVQLVRADGSVASGAAAVFEVLGVRRSLRWLGWLCGHLPPFAAAAEWAYARVAAHRAGISRCERPLRRCRAAARGYRFSAWLYLRGIGAIYMIAFGSLWAQVGGLMGSGGILPAGELLGAVREQFGARGAPLFPTLCWFWSSDASLSGICAAGVGAGLLVVLGIFPAACLAACWILYLSLCVAGGIFMNYQWDALLLEAGFLAIWLAPTAWRHPARSTWNPSPTALFLVRWLLFRLMFLSGAVKLASGDPTWWGLAALDFHYETQPLPNVLAWYAHQAPSSMDHVCCLVMFFIELLVPFWIFGPRALRRLAFPLLVGLQSLIFATGNYTFFNLLSMVLCVPLLDDGLLRRVLRRRRNGRRAPRLRRWPAWVVGPAGAALFLLATQQTTRRLEWPVPWPAGFDRLQAIVAPFRSINSYGLFAVMTTRRSEIIIEGSRDGIEWRPYEFRWKPGDPRRAPGFVAPHQPRLDWQMWFAALGDVRHNPWFLRLAGRLLHGSPEVLALLGPNPFPEGPPKFIRARLYQYHFTAAAERRATGAWWRREEKGTYCPVIQLRE